MKDCNEIEMKAGDPVIWSRTTGGASTLAIGEVVTSEPSFVGVRVIRPGAKFGFKPHPEVGSITRVMVSHRIMILPDKEMW